MSQPIIYIDGQEGSTGLRIRELLENRKDINLTLIPPEKRKESKQRALHLNEADLAILCLPDTAAAEALEMINPHTRVIDTSTERRTQEDWTYGLPELGRSHRQTIAAADRVANPGCYPVGFILTVRPLIESGILPATTPLTVNTVSGYSGGGRKMIKFYQTAPPSKYFEQDAPIPLSLYGLTDTHKHVAEMQKFSLTAQPPMFVPSVDCTFNGMIVCTPIPAPYLSPNTTAESVCNLWSKRYKNEPFVHVFPPTKATSTLRNGCFLDLINANHTNHIELFAFGDERGVVLIARQDNLGKGASGNAVQCMNLMLGFGESEGLI